MCGAAYWKVHQPTNQLKVVFTEARVNDNRF